MEEGQYFKFREQSQCILYIDGNYMLNISRAMNIKLDMEKLFDELTKGMYRFRSHWFAALESSLDRNNNAYRFLDRLRYIPRTRVYAGRMTKRPQGHYETALRTEAGMALGITMMENAMLEKIDYFLILAGDPEYIPAIRAVQRRGGTVRLIYPEYLGDLDPHPDLMKAVDERYPMSVSYLNDFEYTNEMEYEEEIDEEFDEDDDDDFDDLDIDEDVSDDPDEDFEEDELEIVQEDDNY